MIRIERCPVCGYSNLQILKKYKFVFPEVKEYDELTGCMTYKYERLWIFFENIYKNGNAAEFDVVLCRSCGMIFTNPRFSAEEIRIKYNAISQLESTHARPEKQPVLRKNERSRRIYSLITKLQNNENKSKRILDYGGAQGYNLSFFVATGNDCNIIDYVKYDYPQGIKYLCQDLEGLPGGENFDLILLCHVLEHTPEPQDMIKRILPYLSNEGFIYTEVPLGCKREWEVLAEPLTHVNFFSEESIFKCFRGAGLNVVHLSTSYQWVTHGKMWCVNIVGAKRKGNTVVRFKATRQQMGNFLYSLRLLCENPGYYLRKLITRITEIMQSRL